MRLKNWFGTAFGCAFLLSCGEAAEINKQECQSHLSALPLQEADYIRTINEFYRSSVLANSPIASRERSVAAATDPGVYLQLKAVINHEDNQRETTLRIIDPRLALQNAIVKPHLGQGHKTLKVGKITLLENPLELDHKGKFFLELLYIRDAYQGQGMGTKALTAVKELASQLAKKSSFYQTITLVSQDVTHKGRNLAAVPRRVKFYMDNQFSLHDRTIELIKFLDIKYFIDHFDVHQFSDYIRTYLIPKAVAKGASTKKICDLVAINILPLLQASDKFESVPFETLLYYVQTEGNICAHHILERSYFWGGEVSDEEQATFKNYVYFMSYNVDLPAHSSRRSIGPESSLSATEFLQETRHWNRYSLLPDQHRLNVEIVKLMLDAQNYSKIDGNKITRSLKQLIINGQSEHKALKL
ncbi:hypothetical protein [Candidatus Odyssella thessalonicensis]|uniref:hypothetical protein n=1 Tax=Candidatus Odyssella thessalonicensis TaxID=84647 RepID=UPI000225A8C6|nr:hypothetical protein [Candidatus Odyssella thessalonicensis]